MTTQNPENIELRYANILIDYAEFFSNVYASPQDHKAATLALFAKSIEVYAARIGTPCHVVFERAKKLAQTSELA